MEIVLRDQTSLSSDPSLARVSPAQLRLAYSMTIIRSVPPLPSMPILTRQESSFVNSLIDPLQTNYFARSMATLAAELGLPIYFIELRHQATHEDLPSLAVLRSAAHQVPLLSPITVKTNNQSQGARFPLSNLLAPASFSPSCSPVTAFGAPSHPLGRVQIFDKTIPPRSIKAVSTQDRIGQDLSWDRTMDGRR